MGKRRNRLLAWAMSLCLLTGMLPLSGAAYAQDAPDDVTGNIGQTLPGGVEATSPAAVNVTTSALVTGEGYSFNSDNGELTVETNAATKAWQDNTDFDMAQVLSVVLTDAVTEIQRDAFNGCTNLASIEMPDTVSSIGQGAFYGCAKLKLTRLPAALTVIGESAFQLCTSLTELDFSGLTSRVSIDEYAFFKCANLSELTFGAQQPASIGKNAFGSIAKSGTITYPYSARENYTEDWKNKTFGLTDWELVEIDVYIITAGADGNGSIEPSGRIRVTKGASQFFTITPAPGYQIEQVMVDGADQTAALSGNTYTFQNVTQGHGIQASFTETHVHTFGDWEYNESEHWRECTAGDGEKAGLAPHTPSGWIIDTPPTDYQEGSQHRECTMCGFLLESATIAPTGDIYTYRELSDTSAGIHVSGYFTADAALVVRTFAAHEPAEPAGGGT